MSELKPCPFCGGEAQADEDCGKYVVHCKNPDCSWRDTAEEAIEAWNTRHERTCEGLEPKWPYPDELPGSDCPALLCSECNKLFEAGANYCSNCGAKVINND